MIRNPKDFWAGVIYTAIGLAAVVIGKDYGMGSATKMGPAYFPTLLGALLALIGLAAIVRSFLRAGESIGVFAYKGIALVTVATVLFGLLVRGAGIVIAIFVLVLMSAYASVKFRWGHSIALAVGLTVFCVLVFIKGLGIPLPMLGSWFGG
ncbi:MAG TPA: tripartite tricarboxylate transporter TctB family protein [Burkholderiales bacterium]|nr:tripartite tricarboxylate transporter TctB family protein [Burkholderiales bacterium]